jgi:hypothetical protein
LLQNGKTSGFSRGPNGCSRADADRSKRSKSNPVFRQPSPQAASRVARDYGVANRLSSEAT